MDKKRIYFVDDLAGASLCGIGTYRKHLSNVLISRGYEVHVLSIAYGNKYGCVKENGATLHFLKDRNGSLTRDDLVDAKVKNSEDNVLLFNISDIESLLVASKELPLARHVLVIHNFVWSETLDGDTQRLEHLMQTHGATKEEREIYADICNERYAMNIADMVVCLSKSAKVIICRQYNIPSRKVKVIPNGIAPFNTNTSRSDFFLFVGRLTEAKGFPELAEAANAAGVKLVALGEGERYQCERIDYRGHVRDVSTWYDRAMAVAIPSHCEQCAYVGLEAMAHGCLIVSSDAIGLRDMFTEKNAVIFKKGDAESLKIALERVITMSKEEKRQKLHAMKNTLRGHSLEKMAYNYEKKVFS